MTSSTGPMGSAAQQPIPLRKRGDLVIRSRWAGRRRYWVVKDPVAHQYHQLRDQEHSILQMLDGQRSLDQLQHQFENQYAPHKVSLSRLQGLLGVLHREGLVISDLAGQGTSLLERGRRNRRRNWLAACANLLAIRLPGINPEPWLRWIYPRVRWLFSPVFLTACAVLVVAALILVFVQYSAFRARLPDVDSLLSFHNLVLLAIALGGAKILHELGHALTCKHFGGECREMGVMFLVLTPCLYCDVTDSWMLANRWQRIAISAAGIGVELVLAALCTFLWWWSEPGLFNTLCLNLMLVGSVSTVVFNGNPLLRYDGYFMLTDLLDMPNLWQNSRALVSSWCRRLCLGVELDRDRALPVQGRAILGVYAISSMTYRAVVVVAILVFVYKLLQRYQLESLAYLFALGALASLILMPITTFFQMFSDPATGQRVRRTRVVWTLLAAAILLVGLCVIPVPSRVRVPIRVEAAGPQRVYVSEPGMLVQAIELGQPVKAGQTLAVLRSLDLQREVARLDGEIRHTRIQLENLTTLRALAPELAAEVAPLIPATEESLRDKIAQHQQLHSNQSRLRVTAPMAGVVLPGPAVATSDQADELPAWSGVPLREMNLGCQLDRGTTLCLIVQPGRYEVLAYIPQDQVERVRAGQSVRLLLDQLAGQQLTGTVQSIAKVDAQIVPDQIVRELDLPVRKDTTGALRPVGTIYEARIAVAQSPSNLVVGGRGRAKIYVDPQTIAQRLYRSLSSIFSFEL